MARPGKTVAALALAVALAGAGLGAGCGSSDSAPAGAPAGVFDGERAFADLRRQVALGPRPAGSAANRRMTRMLARELRAAGAGQVAIQRPERNVVGILAGEEPGYVVVGAHHDTKDVPALVGANDGASAVAVVLELARSLPSPLPGPSVALVLFDAEEARGERSFLADGLRGSRRYVELAGRPRPPRGVPPLEQIRAMVLFDMVGDCDLQIPREAQSDEGLFGLFAAADPEVFSGRTAPIDDDHLPFLEAGIPAVDLIDFTYGPGGSPGAWWHTTEDTLDKVCPESLQAVGDAAIEAIPQIR